MSSLHVKYRPTTFEEVLGQDTAVKQLIRVSKDRRQRSFIFTGPSGTGKTTLARILANSFAGGKATEANIIEIDAATNSGVDAIKQLLSRTLYRAIGASQVKAVILDEAHRMSAAAWSVLLKPIEEPPDHVFWMICTTEAAKIPKTIQTRCIKFDLKPLKEEDLLEVLVKACEGENANTTDEVLEAIAENSNGSPRQALVYLEQCLDCTTAGAARAVMRAAGQSKEVGDLARLLLAKRSSDWLAATKIINAIDEVEAESVRIILNNYIAAALLKSKSEKDAKNMLRVLSCFATPYNQSERLAPLLLSIGLALGMDQ